MLDKVYAEDTLWQTFLNDSNLQPFLREYTASYAEILSLFIFTLSMMMAAFSGVAIGAGISCWAKDLRGALKLAVGVSLTALVTSFSVLTGNTDPYPAHPPVLLKIKSEKASFFSSLDAYRAKKKNNAGVLPHLMEDLSLFLPQRYFFNTGRVLSKETLDDYDVATLFQRGNEVMIIKDSQAFESWKAEKLNSQFQYKIESLNDQQLIRDWYQWITWSETDKEGNSNPFPKNANRFFVFLFKVVACEILVCFLISVTWFFAGYWRIRNDPEFYELR